MILSPSNLARRPTLNRAAQVVAMAAAILAFGVQAAGAQVTTTTAPAIYRLNKDATFQRGCFAPCLCPMMQETQVRGTFVLTPAGFDGRFNHYTVSDVNWIVSLGDPELRVTGQGKFSIGGEFALQQQLQLDLKVGDEPVQHFDSGLVGAGAPFPEILAKISIHGEYCFDTVIVVSASPVPAAEIHPYHLTSESTFQRGCFDPCDCPLHEPRPILGSFALVDLRRDPLFNEFAVVNVRWSVSSPTTTSLSAGIPVRGYGTYRVGGEFAVQHQLTLDLRVGTEDPARFDSGLVVGGGNFPRIDIPISINGMRCFDTVIDVHARPRRTSFPTIRVPVP